MVPQLYQEVRSAMANPTIKYFPVCNGDTGMIKLADDTTFIIDCNIRESSKGISDPTMFDVKADLVKSLKKDGKFYLLTFSF